MASALKNKIIRLEARLPREKPRYEFHRIIILPDETSDEELQEQRIRYPMKEFIRFSDFANECC